MNLNPIFKEFEKDVGIPVEQDIYEKKEDKYFVFLYEDESPSLYGDNKPLEDTCYMQLKMYTPEKYDYFELKKNTRNYFEDKGFIVSSIFSFVETNVTINGEKKRCTVFSLEYTDTH